MSSAGPSEWQYTKDLAEKARAVLPLVILVTSGVLGMQQAALQRLPGCSLSRAKCRDSLKRWDCCLIQPLMLSDILWTPNSSSVRWP